MLISMKRVVAAAVVALYLWFLLPLTATAFYELYHLTGIDPVYWGYSAFKAAGYYLGVSDYRVHICLGVAAAILLVPALWNALRRG